MYQTLWPRQRRAPRQDEKMLSRAMARASMARRADHLEGEGLIRRDDMVNFVEGRRQQSLWLLRLLSV